LPKNVILGAGLFLLLLMMALFAPCFSNFFKIDPQAVNMQERLEGISWRHPMGTDQLGRDCATRILYAARTSLVATVTVVLASLLIGVILGGLAGYCGGVVDDLLMRLVDIMMAFPSFIIAIAVTGLLGASTGNMILALLVTSWVGYARMMRGSVLTLKNITYVEAVRAMGSGRLNTLVRHILPNAIHPLLVYATFNASHTLLAISGLSFLGLGAPPPTPEWGAMLNEASAFMGYAPHLFIFPGLMIMLTVLGFNLIGDGLRDFLDPRLKQEVDL
jgi:peptide/nickel transport system permease protein